MSNVVNQILGGGTKVAKVAQEAAGMTPKRKPAQVEFGQVKDKRKGGRAGRSLLFSNDETGVKSTTLG